MSGHKILPRSVSLLAWGSLPLAGGSPPSGLTLSGCSTGSTKPESKCASWRPASECTQLGLQLNCIAKWLVDAITAVNPKAMHPSSLFKLSPGCRKTTCAKNHVKHSTNTTTGVDEAKIHLEHHKNSGRQGPVDYEVASDMVQVWALLEAAAAFQGPTARSMFFPVLEYKNFGKDLYADSYMSMIITKQLSKCGFKVGANDVRHLFSTMFSLYLGQATFSVDDLSVAYLREAAAVMTGSSSKTWNTTYDANARVNGYKRVVKHYPTFKLFVNADFARVQATVDRNPITGELHG